VIATIPENGVCVLVGVGVASAAVVGVHVSCEIGDEIYVVSNTSVRVLPEMHPPLDGARESTTAVNAPCMPAMP
jgi:hypothetical protein